MKTLKIEAQETLTKLFEILDFLEDDGDFELTIDELNTLVNIEKRLKN